MGFGLTEHEWSGEIEELVEALEEASEERDLTREEQALLDVVETVEMLLEEDGLHDFWQSGITHSRIINSFDLVGASGMVDLLNASQWCQTRSEDRAQYSGRESDYLTEIEEGLPEALAEINELLGEFIEDELGG